MIHRLVFDYARPPLSENHRIHWRVRAATVKDVRLQAALKARDVPVMSACAVSLVWVVKDKRRRDSDNLVPTLKAMCDGIVDAGVVSDDTPDLMHKTMPVIVYDKGADPFMYLDIVEVQK